MHVIPIRLLGGISLMVVLAYALAGCGAVLRLQRPPDPEPGRNMWRELVDNGERK